MTGQLSLFGGDTRQSAAASPSRTCPEIPKDEVLRLEKELIGFYVTGHPLDAFRKVLSSMTGIARCTEEHYHDGERVTVGGLITGVRIRSTKKGERMATFMLEDLTGSIGVIAFPRTYGECRSQIEEDQPVAITAY